MFFDTTMILLILAATSLIVVLLWKLKAKSLGKSEIEKLSTEIADLRREQSETKAFIAQSQTEGLRLATETVAKQVGESIRTFHSSLTQNLSTSKVEIQQQLSSTQKVVTSLHEQLGSLGKSTEQIQDIGKELRSLQTVLQAPKLRGNFGEFLLQELLQSMLPPSHFEMPFSFRDGTMVDAVVHLTGKKISIDSKFPLESFRRMAEAQNEADREAARKDFVHSVRLRVDEIADKYIRPEEDTFGFALMYLPSEAIYYEIVVRDQDLDNKRSPLRYALSKKVIPVSPSSFYAYLATIAFGLHGMQIEKEAEEIRGQVTKLQNDFTLFLEELRRIDLHLDRAKKKFDEALDKGGRLHKRMGKISGVVGPKKEVDLLPRG